jgi:hypothetical protein
MNRKSLSAVILALFFGMLLARSASAQFGAGLFNQMNLPQDDFVWTWGNQRSAGRGMSDISILGNEAGFRCTLTGKLRVGSQMSRTELRQFESDLRGQMRFIQSAAGAMNGLDVRGELEWAKLDCVKPKRKEKE